MRIDSIHIKNFRRLADFQMSFHQNLTVIVAKNGQGKTTLMDGVSALFGTFLGAFDLGKGRGIEPDDARLAVLGTGPENEAQYPVVLAAEGKWEGQSYLWKRTLNGPKNKTTVKDAQPLTDYGRALQEKIREDAGVVLPIVAYYGTGRLWLSHRNITRKTVLSESRTMGYEDCISAASNYKQLQQWMTKATLAELQASSKGAPNSELSARIRGICRVVDKLLEPEGLSDFHYDLEREELVMRHEKHGLMPVSLLSDGVRAMLALTADLAFRCTRLNGHLGENACSETSGIVMIDELDMHLHPSWQQHVLSELVKAFPMVQFIVTTHSPQLISSVPKESIRILNWSDEEVDVVEPLFSQGAEAGRILEDLFQVPSRVQSLDIVRKLKKYQELVQADMWDTEEAIHLWEELEAWGGEQEEELQRLKMDVRMKEYERNEFSG